MLNRYIKEKLSVKERVERLILLFPQYWQICVSVTTGGISYVWMQEEVSDDIMKAQNSTLINASSIITAILITFLVAKVIQLKQEKNALKEQYQSITLKVHHFRGAVLPLLQSYDFWPKGMKYEMEHTYSDLEYYDIRKVVAIHATKLTPLAEQFIQNETGPKKLYLQLLAFFNRPLSLEEARLNGEYEYEAYYDHDLLQVWHRFDCGNGLWYYFRHEFANYSNDFSFAAISFSDQNSVIEHCKKVDSKRFNKIQFGHDLYAELGSHFHEYLGTISLTV